MNVETTVFCLFNQERTLLLSIKSKVHALKKRRKNFETQLFSYCDQTYYLFRQICNVWILFN